MYIYECTPISQSEYIRQHGYFEDKTGFNQTPQNSPDYIFDELKHLWADGLKTFQRRVEFNCLVLSKCIYYTLYCSFPFCVFSTSRQSIFSLTARQVLLFCFFFLLPKQSRAEVHLSHVKLVKKTSSQALGPPVHWSLWCICNFAEQFLLQTNFLTSETGRRSAKAWLVGIVTAEPAPLNKYRYVELATWCTTPVIQCNLAAVFLLLPIKLRFDCCVRLKLTDAVSSPPMACAAQKKHPHH